MTLDPVTRIEVYYAIESAFASPPVRPTDLIDTARSHSARTAVLDALAELPADHVFVRLRDVWTFFPTMPTGAVGDL